MQTRSPLDELAGKTIRHAVLDSDTAGSQRLTLTLADGACLRISARSVAGLAAPELSLTLDPPSADDPVADGRLAV
ncbi:MAG: hypothetical protein QM639_16660 [Rhodocyclaceae bacterium]